jgi:hypothetical protein
MPKKKPWNSKLTKIYHDNSKCTTGNNIERKNLRNGTGNKKHCKECIKLNRQGK